MTIKEMIENKIHPITGWRYDLSKKTNNKYETRKRNSDNNKVDRD